MSECRNFSPSPEFKWLCDELFQKIHDTSVNRHLIGKPVTVRFLEIIANFIKLWRSTVGNDIYPALRLIIPYRDKRVYNIKENTLIKALCHYLRLPKNSDTEKRLLRWKQRAPRGVKLSDFCVEEIRKRQKDYEGPTRITIDQLNGHLDEIAQAGNGKRMGHMALLDSRAFNYCLKHMTFEELKFFFDILLKTRVISGLEVKFLNAWHPDAQDYLSVVSDLYVLSQRLYDPNERLRKVDLSINISHAFEPQLAKRTHASYEHVASSLGKNFIIEEKMDGERLQIHYMNYGEQIKYLSRRGVDFSYLYGENISKGPVSSSIKLHPNVKDCILDGEMITFDIEKDMVLPFGLVKNSAMNHVQAEITGVSLTDSHRPLFIAFDLVYLNGKSLTSLELWRRKDYLSKILTPVEKKVEIIQYHKSDDAMDIKNSLEHAISVGSEGIVLKNLQSKYNIASRNSDWIKIKPEYLEQFGENMDLLVIGRDQGKKDSFLCGLSVNNTENPTERPKFLSFCTIANGFSQEEFKDIERNTRGKWHIFSEEPPDKRIFEFGSKLPYEWIYPEDSVVLEVKARAIDNKDSEKKRYRTGCTLHFGYCKQIRYDKSWKDATSLADFEEMKEARNFYHKRTQHEVSKEKRKSSKRARINIVNISEPRRLDDPISYIFQRCKFRIISDFFYQSRRKRISQEDLCSLVLENGGEVIYNNVDSITPEENLYIISDRLTYECKVLVDKGLVIVNPLWIFKSIEAGAKLPLTDEDIFAATRKEHERVMPQPNNITEKYTGYSKIAYPESSYYNNNMNISSMPIFRFDRLKIAMIDSPSVSRAYLRKVEFTIKCHGGTIENMENADIIVVVNELISKKELLSIRKKIAARAVNESVDSTPRIPRIVDVSWIFDSIKGHHLVDAEDYQCL